MSAPAPFRIWRPIRASRRIRFVQAVLFVFLTLAVVVCFLPAPNRPSPAHHPIAEPIEAVADIETMAIALPMFSDTAEDWATVPAFEFCLLVLIVCFLVRNWLASSMLISAM